MTKSIWVKSYLVICQINIEKENFINVIHFFINFKNDKEKDIFEIVGQAFGIVLKKVGLSNWKILIKGFIFQHNKIAEKALRRVRLS